MLRSFGRAGAVLLALGVLALVVFEAALSACRPTETGDLAAVAERTGQVASPPPPPSSSAAGTAAPTAASAARPDDVLMPATKAGPVFRPREMEAVQTSRPAAP